MCYETGQFYLLTTAPLRFSSATQLPEERFELSANLLYAGAQLFEGRPGCGLDEVLFAESLTRPGDGIAFVVEQTPDAAH